MVGTVTLVVGAALLVWVFIYVEGAWNAPASFLAAFAAALVLAGGAFIARSYRLPADAARPCPRCAETNPTDAPFCSRCGQAL